VRYGYKLAEVGRNLVARTRQGKFQNALRNDTQNLEAVHADSRGVTRGPATGATVIGCRRRRVTPYPWAAGLQISSEDEMRADEGYGQPLSIRSIWRWPVIQNCRPRFYRWFSVPRRSGKLASAVRDRTYDQLITSQIWGQTLP